MPAAALIHIGGSPGPSLNITAGATVSLSNADNTGVSSWAWTILDKPPGSTATLSAPAASTTTFVADVEGTYLIELAVNTGLVDAISARTVAAVKQLTTRTRVPAAGEQQEADAADGWAASVNELLRMVDAVYADPGRLVAVNTTGGSLARGTPVYLDGVSTILSGLPGERKLAGVAAADSATLTSCLRELYIVEGDVAGATPAANGALLRLRARGPVVVTASYLVGDRIYVKDGGGLDNAPGTVSREVGVVLEASGGTNRIAFDGALSPMLLAAHTVTAHNAVELRVSGAGAARLVRDAGTGVLKVGTEVNAALELIANNVSCWSVATTGSLEALGSQRKVRNVADPADPQDAATKAYVDAYTPFWDVRLQQEDKTTADAIATTIITYADKIPDGYGAAVAVVVQATRRDRAAACAWLFLASFTNVGGVHNLYGSAITIAQTDANSTWGANITDGGGTGIAVEIVGQDDTTIDWRCSGFVLRRTGP